jgi:hypothetical protein
MTAYGYCRVSTARQASEGESLDVQRRQIEGYAHMHGLTLRGVTVEEGVSGSIPVHERPKGGPLFAKLQKGDVVIAPKLDRLFRSALDALQVVEDLRKRGVSLHLLDLGGDISGNGLSKLFLTNCTLNRLSSIKFPYLLQYAVDRSGHHGIWVYPKQMIKPKRADGTSGFIPDYLIATRSSLGYF